MARTQRSNSDRFARAELIEDLAKQGYSSRQMPAKVGVTEETVRQIARDFEVAIPADRSMRNTRRFDSNRIISTIVDGLDGTRMSIDVIDYEAVDREQMPRWIDGLRQAESSLRRLRTQLEAILTDSERRCPVCDTAVTGRADQVYCGATCRQRAHRNLT